ncbi:MAG: DeoR family transcriptional regulator, partial [Candidatus Paceibacterota bacterium]
MNDTILNPRQKQILELIAKSRFLSRLDIKKKLPAQFQASIPTISRDLAYLAENNLIVKRGKGRNTNYSFSNSSPLLNFVDIDQYFSLEPDQRTVAKKTFDFGIFAVFSNLITRQEITELNKINKSFSRKLESLDKDVRLKEIERFIIELSWKSSKIEGNTYSLLDTETLIKQRIEAKGHLREESIMILNHKSAFEYILDKRQEYKTLTFAKIIGLHDIL